MKILIAGVANTLEFYRSDPALGMTLQIIDPSDASVIETPVVTDDATDETIALAIARYATSFIAAGLVKGVKYRVEHAPVTTGPYQIIETIGVDTDGADNNNIKYPFDAAMAAGCAVKGLRSTASHTPVAATYAGKTVWAQWTDDNGLITRESYLVLKYELRCPITSDDIKDRWPRLETGALPKWQQVCQVGWQPQIDKAWDHLRDYFYNNGKILDRVVSASLLEEAVFALVEKQITNMGHDPAKSGDPLRDAQNRAGAKASQILLQALGAPHDVDGSDSNTNTGDGYKKGVRLNYLASD